MVKLFAVALAMSAISAQDTQDPRNRPILRAAGTAEAVPHGNLAGFKPLNPIWPDFSALPTNVPDGTVVAAVSMTIRNGRVASVKLLEGRRPYTAYVVSILQTWNFEMPTDGTSQAVFDVTFCSANGRIIDKLVQVKTSSPSSNSPLHPANEPRPVYPPSAFAIGLEGSVDLRLSVNRDGTVSAAEVIRGPELLQQSAIDATNQLRFKPDSSLPRQVEISIPFRLPEN